MIKALKRKVSRMQFEAPDPTQLSVPPPTSPTGEGPAGGGLSTSPKNNNHIEVGSPPKNGSSGGGLPPQYDYQRPLTVLAGYSPEEFKHFEHHLNRPIVVPKVSAKESPIRSLK